MKRIFILLLLVTMHLSSRAQQWSWVSAANTTSLSLAAPGVLAPGKDAVMWGTLVQKNLLWGSAVYGNYAFAEYDTAGNPGAAITLNGRAMLIDAHTDAAGNYYVLGKVFDTATFSTGFQVVRGVIEPKTFLCRLDKGTLALNWLKFLGPDDNANANAFTVTNTGVYVFVDTAFTTTVLYRYDLATGNDNVILTQNDAGVVTSLQVDGHGNIYVSGGGVSMMDIDFNGHHVTVPAGMTYPQYIVRYKPDGTYDWNTLMGDVTVVPRQLSLASDNSIYYSGPIFDSFSLGGFEVRRPNWVYDYLVCRMDSTGDIKWLRQLPDTMAGDAQLRNEYHAVACSDGSLSVSAAARYYVNWGNGVITNNGNDNIATVVNYAANGSVNWALPVLGDYTVPGYIGTDGQNIWFSGTGFDSTNMQFGTLTIPTSYYNYKSFIAKIKPGIPPTTGVSSSSATLSVSVFPNPASDHIFISYNNTKPAQITLTDAGGRKVHSKATTGTVLESINIAGYPAGIYFVEIIAGNERLVQKIVIQ